MNAQMIPLLLLLPTAAMASEGALELGVSAGATVTDPLEVLGSSVSVTPRVGYFFTDTMAVELDLGFSSGQTRVGTPDTYSFLSLTPRVNMVGMVWEEEPINLLFTAGLGLWYKSVGDDGALGLPVENSTDIDFVGNAGPGLRMPLGDSFAVRTDLRWMLSVGAENYQNRGDAFVNWEWTAGAVVLLGGEKDTDKDGISDEFDSCIEVPEDFDQFEDDDGCPEADNDQDGIVDADDGCPLEAEDLDEFEDSDGCPDSDNDGDGVPDVDDACPMDTGMASAQGCPDADEDGITDSDDECERDAGPESAHGCPDGDADTIPDYRDACPEEAGWADADPYRSNGCKTRVYPGVEGVMVTELVKFSRSGKHQASSNLLVDEIRMVLEGVPGFKKVEVQVISEGEAGDERAMATAQRRAEALVEWLTGAGVAEDRLSAKGIEAPAAEAPAEGEEAAEAAEPTQNVLIPVSETDDIAAMKKRYVDEDPERKGGDDAEEGGDDAEEGGDDAEEGGDDAEEGEGRKTVEKPEEGAEEGEGRKTVEKPEEGAEE